MKKQYKAILQSENIDYIELNIDLINDYLLMVNDQDIQKKISKKIRTYTYDEELAWVKEKLEEKAIIFSMIERTTGNFIGNIEFMKVNNGSAEMGICITPSYQNMHYGTEAIKTMIDYAFNKIKLDEIYLIVFSNNHRAIHCYKKIGFVEYKVEKNVAIIDNENVDDIYMKLKK